MTVTLAVSPFAFFVGDWSDAESDTAINFTVKGFFPFRTRDEARPKGPREYAGSRRRRPSRRSLRPDAFPFLKPIFNFLFAACDERYLTGVYGFLIIPPLKNLPYFPSPAW